MRDFACRFGDVPTTTIIGRDDEVEAIVVAGFCFRILMQRLSLFGNGSYLTNDAESDAGIM